MWRKDFLLLGTYLWKTLQILTYVFDWLCFTQCLTSFSSIDHLLRLCARILILFVFEDLTSIIRTGLPILVEVVDLVSSSITFLSQTTLLRWLTFVLASQTVIFTVLFFWIYLFVLTLVFVLQWLSLHWEILIILLSLFPFNFHHIHNGMPRYIALLMTILRLIGAVFVIIWEMFHRRISLNSVLLLLLANFLSEFRLELMYISLIESIRSSLTHLHGFQLLMLLP